MKKTKRKIGRWAMIALLLCLLFSVVVFFLLHRYKDVIRKITIDEINHHLVADATLGDVSVTFFSTFPFPSIRFDDVLIRDTLWENHQHNLFQAKQLRIYFDWFSLFRKQPAVSDVVLHDAIIHIYTDTSGYSNLNLIEHDNQSGHHPLYPEFKLQHTRIIIENKLKNAKHDIDASTLNCKLTKKEKVTTIDLTIKSMVHGIGFNLDRGSYLSEKSLHGNIQLNYIPKDKIDLTKVDVLINDHPIGIQGRILLHADTMSYDLLFKAKHIKYKEATALLTHSIRENISIVDILDPFDVEANVSGQMAQFVVPEIKVHFQVNDASMETPIGHLDHCHFSGTFHNRLDTLTKPGDENSTLVFHHATLTWKKFSIKSDTIVIINLLKPFLDCHLASEFPLHQLNELEEIETLKFLKGTGKLDVKYHGSIAGDLNMLTLMNGSFSFNDAEIQYVPRRLMFKNCSAEMEFKHQDLILHKLNTTIGRTPLHMTGSVENLLSMLNRQPEKLILNLAISSSSMDLGDFISYVGASSPSSKKAAVKKTKISTVVNNMEKMLRDGTARLTINAGTLQYKKFSAQKIKASLSLEPNKINVRDMSLQYAKGTASLKGSLTTIKGGNQLKLESNIQSVDISTLFNDFDNFGQDAVTGTNTKGSFTSKILMNGELTDKATIKENSMKGTVDFLVKNGELIQFEPLMKLKETAFKNRDLSNVKFGELKNNLRIDGSAYHMERMEIRSNVAVLFIEGVYDPKHGTDMSIQVPVTTLTNQEHEYAENKGKVGVNIRLRAKTGDDGKLKVTWDPLNKSGKQRKEENKNEPERQKRKG